MRNVVLLSTRRLPPTYFDTVIEDLGGDPTVGLNVVAWMPPSGYVADKVETFTLIGPGRMPAKPAPEPEPTDSAAAPSADAASDPSAGADGPSDESPDAVIAPEAVAEPDSVSTEGEITPAAAEVPSTAGDPDGSADANGPADGTQVTGSTDTGSTSTGSGGSASAGSGSTDAGSIGSTDTGSTGAGQAPASGASDNTSSTTHPVDSEQKSTPDAPKAASKPKPTGVKRVVKAVAWRYRRLRKAGAKAVPASVKKSRAVQFLRRNKQTNEVAEKYWGRLETRPDVLEKVTKADVVIALDAGAIWAGWQLGQRYGQTPVVLGLPAARRELDRIKAGR